MRSLGRSQSYDDKISTVTATTTAIQPPASATITQAGTEVAPAAGQDQPWDEAQFNQVAQSLKTLLEEYEELSNRILESLILTATHAEDVYKSDPEQGQGNGDNEGAHTGSHDTNVLSLTGSLGITGNHPSLLRTKASTGSRKGKARQQSDSPLPSLMSDTAPQEADLEQLPMHRFEGQSWPPGLLRRQRLARSATVWIATEWPKVYATHQQQTVQPTSSGMIRKQIDAIACIKDAISTLWSLDSQSHELSTIVINILRKSSSKTPPGYSKVDILTISQKHQPCPPPKSIVWII
ncbi:hypothetical protein DFQ26_001365 [Actinomortierella ambigua]|nr:hypothetical protein DFQ26_001365 [Actinomortierella ambigua]